MSNQTPEQLDLTQPIDRVVKQIVDLATAAREAKGWWQAVLRLVPKEHHAPADVIRYLEERLNAWGGLLTAAGFEQGDGVWAAQRITDEVRAYARLRGAFACRLGVPRGAADAVLLERLNGLTSLAHGEESQRELNAGLKAQLEEARPKAAMWESLKRLLDDVPDSDVVPRLRVAIAMQRQVDGWLQVARLLCGDACDLSDVSGVVAAAQKQRDEVDALRACIHPAAWARLKKALGSPKTITQIVEQVEHLVESRDAEKARHADELTKAQTLVDQWDMQYQDLRDKVADFHTQISRALGVEPLSLTADEMLRRINEGAATWRAHEHLVKALHVGRSAAEVAPDELVEWAKQTYAHRALVDRLTAALRRCTPFASVEELCNLLENGRIAEMIRRNDAWESLVKAYNEALVDDVPFLPANASKANEHLTLAVKRGVQLLGWMRKQTKSEG